MPLFDLTDGSLTSVDATSFTQEGVLERQHLQAAIRDNISVLGDDLLVIAEEFGDFQDSQRRIDLLCIDIDARPVVVELKRGSDGGHMDLQAIRYAAFVQAMTFEELVSIYRKYLEPTEEETGDDARSRLLEFLSGTEEEAPEIRRDVRIILAAADFSKEITTTALWLNDVYQMDVRCVRLKPYRVDNRLLLDIDQLIPLPEAEELMVKLRQRDAASRNQRASTKDYTKYIIKAQGEESGLLNKRHAVLHMVHAVMRCGATPMQVQSILRPRGFLGVEGDHNGEDLIDMFTSRYPKARRSRWFFDDPIRWPEETWVVSTQWGSTTEFVLAQLRDLDPKAGITFTPVVA